VLVRQVLGAIAQFDKATMVAKLKAARDRKRKVTGKVEGRKSHIEREGGPILIARVKALRDQRPRLSLRDIAAERLPRRTAMPSCDRSELGLLSDTLSTELQN
jgi:hypothetical protein